MPTNVLVPIDGSDQSFGGITYALESFPDAAFTTLYVVDVDRDSYEYIGVPEDWRERARETAEECHIKAQELADQFDTDIHTTTVFGTPHKKIIEHTIENDIDHVVMGSHGDSPIESPFLGHVSESVIRRAPTSVTVVPYTVSELKDRDRTGEILVPIDESEMSTLGLEYALDNFEETRITALHVIEQQIEYRHERLQGTYVGEELGELREYADELLASAEELADEYDREIDTAVSFGKPHQSIVEYATDNSVDQIVMGSHGRSGLDRILLGSVAETVARRSPLPVTVVRE